MKTVFTLPLFFFLASQTWGQEIRMDLDSFDKMVISPFIKVILKEGHKEEILITYEGVERHEINAEVNGKTLNLYLDHARYFDNSTLENWNENGKNDYHHHYGESRYKYSKVTAYISYKALEYIEVRGDESLTCLGSLYAKDLTIKGYGSGKLAFTHIDAQNLRVVLAGENKFYIKSGKVDFQKYRVYGENEIDTKGLEAKNTVTNVYGDNKLLINSSQDLRVSAFGDSRIVYTGNPDIDRRILIGENKIFPMKRL